MILEENRENAVEEAVQPAVIKGEKCPGKMAFSCCATRGMKRAKRACVRCSKAWQRLMWAKRSLKPFRERFRTLPRKGSF